MTETTTKFRVERAVVEPSLEVSIFDAEGKLVQKGVITPPAFLLKKGPGATEKLMLVVHELDGDILQFVAVVASDGSGFLLQHDGKLLSKTKLKVYDDPELYATAAVVMPPPAKRSAHPKRHTCQSCVWFDATQGRSILLDPTHNYDNGGFSMWAEITSMYADTYGLPGLTKDNVGYCAETKSLLATLTPACERFEPVKKPRWLRRLFPGWRS